MLCSRKYIITVVTVRWLARLTATYQRQYSGWHLYIYSKSLARLNSVTDLVDFVLREAVHTSETSAYFSKTIWCYRRLLVIFIPACFKQNSVPCATKHTTRNAKTKSRYFKPLRHVSVQLFKTAHVEETKSSSLCSQENHDKESHLGQFISVFHSQESIYLILFLILSSSMHLQQWHYFMAGEEAIVAGEQTYSVCESRHGKGGEGGGRQTKKTLLFHTADSLPAFRLNRSPAKMFSDNCRYKDAF
jgi:hypothetical protein